MLIVKRTFRRTTGGCYWLSGSRYAVDPLEFCDFEFSMFLWGNWELDNELEKLTLSLYDCPSVNRLPVEVVLDDTLPTLLYGGYEVEHKSFDKKLMPYIGKSVYLQVEYDG